MRIDRDVAAEVIERLKPLGIEAALAAQAARSRANEDKRGQVELALEQAAMRSGARVANTMLSIPTIASSLPSWKSDGRTAWRSCAIWRPSWRD